MSRFRKQRRWGFERLEDRTMLAGDVSVTVDGLGNLNVVSLSNLPSAVRVLGTGVANQVSVQGLNDASSNLPTTINGAATPAPVLFNGVTGSLLVNLSSGLDEIFINRINIAGSLQITTPAGRATVQIGEYADVNGSFAGVGQVIIGGNLTINNSLAANTVFIGRTFVTGNINLNATVGAAGYNMSLYNATATNVTMTGGGVNDLFNLAYLAANNVTVNSGTLNDVISVTGSNFRGAVNLSGGDGIDTIAVDFSVLEGPDAIAGPDVIMDSGTGNDFILFARCLARGEDVSIFSGTGLDNVVIGRYYADITGALSTGGNSVGILRMDTGGDADTADVQGNVIDQFFALMQAGDDRLAFLNNRLTISYSLDGGAGTDQLNNSGNTALSMSIMRFEIFGPF